MTSKRCETGRQCLQADIKLQSVVQTTLSHLLHTVLLTSKEASLMKRSLLLATVMVEMKTTFLIATCF